MTTVGVECARDSTRQKSLADSLSGPPARRCMVRRDEKQTPLSRLISRQNGYRARPRRLLFGCSPLITGCV